jgi:predicted transcriptional regulator
MADQPTSNSDLLALTADIVSAHVSNNSISVTDLPNLICNVHASLASLNGTPAPSPVEQVPAVSVRASIKPDYIVCLEDGKKFKMLKRHLMTYYQMTPADYRAKWGLPANYPMVAPNYAKFRQVIAVKIGLGRTRVAPERAPKPIRKARGPRKAIVAKLDG